MILQELLDTIWKAQNHAQANIAEKLFATRYFPSQEEANSGLQKGIFAENRTRNRRILKRMR